MPHVLANVLEPPALPSDIQRLKAQLATTEATLAAVSAGLHAGGGAWTRTAAGAGEVSGDGGRRRRQVLTERDKSPGSFNLKP